MVKGSIWLGTFVGFILMVIIGGVSPVLGPVTEGLLQD